MVLADIWSFRLFVKPQNINKLLLSLLTGEWNQVCQVDHQPTFFTEHFVWLTPWEWYEKSELAKKTSLIGHQTHSS